MSHLSRVHEPVRDEVAVTGSEHDDEPPRRTVTTQAHHLATAVVARVANRPDESVRADQQ
jgi:hypothetical protein